MQIFPGYYFEPRKLDNIDYDHKTTVITLNKKALFTIHIIKYIYNYNSVD